MFVRRRRRLAQRKYSSTSKQSNGSKNKTVLTAWYEVHTRYAFIARAAGIFSLHLDCPSTDFVYQNASWVRTARDVLTEKPTAVLLRADIDDSAIRAKKHTYGGVSSESAGSRARSAERWKRERRRGRKCDPLMSRQRTVMALPPVMKAASNL